MKRSLIVLLHGFSFSLHLSARSKTPQSLTLLNRSDSPKLGPLVTRRIKGSKRLESEIRGSDSNLSRARPSELARLRLASVGGTAALTLARVLALAAVVAAFASALAFTLVFPFTGMLSLLIVCHGLECSTRFRGRAGGIGTYCHRSCQETCDCGTGDDYFWWFNHMLVLCSDRSSDLFIGRGGRNILTRAHKVSALWAARQTFFISMNSK
jgi:hypothetical protein